MPPDYTPKPQDRLPASMRFLPPRTVRTVTMPPVGSLRDGAGRLYPANRTARRAAK